MFSGVYLYQTSIQSERYLVTADWLKLLPVTIRNAATRIDLY